jgi:hypothetical protein
MAAIAVGKLCSCVSKEFVVRTYLFRLAVFLLASFGSVPAGAGFLNLLREAAKTVSETAQVGGKGAKIAGKGAKIGEEASVAARIGGRAAVHSLSRAEAITLAAGAAVHVDVRGPNLILETISTGAQKALDLSDDLRKFAHDIVTQAVSATQPRSFVLTRETARKLGDRIDDLSHAGDVYLVEAGLGRVPLRRLPWSGKNSSVSLKFGLGCLTEWTTPFPPKRLNCLGRPSNGKKLASFPYSISPMQIQQSALLKPPEIA